MCTGSIHPGKMSTGRPLLFQHEKGLGAHVEMRRGRLLLRMLVWCTCCWGMWTCSIQLNRFTVQPLLCERERDRARTCR